MGDKLEETDRYKNYCVDKLTMEQRKHLFDRIIKTAIGGNMSSEQGYYGDILLELDVYPGDLTKWEIDFIESMCGKIDSDEEYEFSHKERAVLDSMKEKYL